MKKFDLIIIGAGAAGFAAAMKASEYKLDVLFINNDEIGLGGTCVNVGCVPTKLLLNIGNIITQNRRIKIEGLKLSILFNFEKIIESKNLLIQNLRIEKYEKVLNNLPNIKFIRGHVKFISNTEISINNKEYIKADKFIIATGSHSYIPPISGLKTIKYYTNIEALQIKKLPESMLIIGGGALGLEFSQIFSHFGTKVYLIEALEKLVPSEEPEISDLIKEYLKQEGIEVYTNARIKNIEKSGNKIRINALIEQKQTSFTVDRLLLATGRRPNTHHLDIQNTDIKLGKKGEIIVDEYMQATKNIWAAGDVTGEPMLETVAAREGMISAANALSNNKVKMDYRIIPHAIFIDPQIASVGLTDLEANKQGFECNCRTIPFKLIPKSKIINDDRGIIKIVINNKTEEILGIHLLLKEAAELIHECVMIIKNKMKIKDVIETIHVFPTLSEAIKLACQSFKRDITNMTCCAE
ncbi:MAG: mercury(II) reductase [Promethearchaeota archaeon]